jgi:hypothetical protein
VGSVGSVGSFSHFLVYLNTIIFLFYTELKCLLAPLLKTYPCETPSTPFTRFSTTGLLKSLFVLTRY